jgi:hypothetical protein
MREFKDEEGKLWQAIAADAVVAHAKPGAVLAFVPVDAPGSEPIESNVTFNSQRAADFALRTMSEKELQRRLSLARATI